jgi:hypothetical protein
MQWWQQQVYRPSRPDYLDPWPRHVKAPSKDPYGRDIVSPLDRPESAEDPLPPKGMAEFPRALVSERDVVEELEKGLRVKAPKLRRILFATWNANKQDIKFDELVEQLRKDDGLGLVDGWMPGWTARYNKVVAEKIAPIWEAQAKDGDDLMVPGLAGLPNVSPAMLDDQEFSLHAYLDRWVAHRGADFVTEISETDRRALNAIIRRNIGAGGDQLGPTELARVLRASVGLREQQVHQMYALEAEMSEDDVPVGKRNDILNTRAARLIARRANVIARTELAFAFNFGMQQSMVAARDSGMLLGYRTVKIWYTQLDERVCTFCGPLHEKEVGLDDTYPGATKTLPNTYVPPAHPQCRCVILYELVEVEVEAEVPAPEPVAVEAKPEPIPVLPEPDDLLLQPLTGSSALTEDQSWQLINAQLASMRADQGGINPEVKAIKKVLRELRALGNETPAFVDHQIDQEVDQTDRDGNPIGKINMREFIGAKTGNFFAQVNPAAYPPEGKSTPLKIRSEGFGNSFEQKVAGDIVRLGHPSQPEVNHELGHWLEMRNGRNHDLAKAFINRRTKGKGTKTIREAVGIDRDGTVALGDFYSAYVGRVYKGKWRSTEVIAMGAQRMTKLKDAVRFFREDPEHFAVTVLAMSGGAGWRK